MRSPWVTPAPSNAQAPAAAASPATQNICLKKKEIDFTRILSPSQWKDSDEGTWPPRHPWEPTKGLKYAMRLEKNQHISKLSSGTQWTNAKSMIFFSFKCTFTFRGTLHALPLALCPRHSMQFCIDSFLRAFFFRSILKKMALR